MKRKRYTKSTINLEHETLENLSSHNITFPDMENKVVTYFDIVQKQAAATGTFSLEDIPISVMTHDEAALIFDAETYVMKNYGLIA